MTRGISEARTAVRTQRLKNFRMAWLTGLVAGLLLILSAALAEAQNFRFTNVVIEGNQRIGDASLRTALRQIIDLKPIEDRPSKEDRWLTKPGVMFL